MILLCTSDDRLAKAMAATMGNRVQTVPVESVMEGSYSDRCIRVAGAMRPSAIFVDVRSGTSAARMLDMLPWLQKASPLSAIIVMTVSPTDEEIAEIEDLGAYTFLDLSRKDLPEQIRRAVASVESGEGAERRWGIQRRARARARRRQVH